MNEFGSGGMQTKIEAAKICQLAGSSMVIANGLHNNPITKIIEQNNCTWFSPKVSKLDARKKWLSSFANDVKKLRNRKQKIKIVSSGAIALGCKKKNYNKKI